jgi:hypothetical protein
MTCQMRLEDENKTIGIVLVKIKLDLLEYTLLEQIQNTQ